MCIVLLSYMFIILYSAIDQVLTADSALLHALSRENQVGLVSIFVISYRFLLFYCVCNCNQFLMPKLANYTTHVLI